MPFDYTVQEAMTVPPCRIETGKLSFATTDLTVEVPTKMTKIISGFGVTQDGTGVIQDAVITDGCVTFTRLAGGTSGATFEYTLFGR